MQLSLWEGGLCAVSLARQEQAILAAPADGHTSGRGIGSSLQGAGRQLVYHRVEHPRGGDLEPLT